MKAGPRMNIGLDFHDTISSSPDFFRKLIKMWDDKVYIVTGTPLSKIHEVEDALKELGINKDDYEQILCGYEYDKSGMNLSHFKKMAKHKLKLLKKYNIQVYYDDNPYYTSYIKDYGITVFQTVLSEKYLIEFEKSDPFFTCNLQKMQFDYLEKLEDNELERLGVINADGHEE
jgi:hypothetical protein